MTKKSRHWLSVLNKMIAFDLFKTLLAVLSVVVIIIVSRKFVKILAKAVEGEIASDTLAMFLGLKIITVSIAFLPVSAFMAVLIVLGRMYRDHEMDVIFSAGAGFTYVYRAVLLFLVPMTALTLLLSFKVGPWSEGKVQELLHNDKQTADIRGIAAGRFSEYSQGDLVFYIENIDKDNQLHNIFVQHRQDNNLGIVTAKTGRLEMRPEGRYIVLEQGARSQGVPGRQDFVIENFAEYGLLIEEKNGDNVIYEKEAVDSLVLLQSGALPDIAELQRRLSIPLGIFVLGILAVPLSKLSPRSGVYGNLIAAILIYLIYGNFHQISQSLVIKGTIPIWFGFVWVYVLMLLFAAAFIARLLGFRWLLSWGQTKEQS